MIATHHLDAMDADEVDAYIRHRLTRVDWQGNPDFDTAAIAELHEQSGGIPRRINQLAHRLLLQAALEGAETIGAEAVKAVASDLGADAPAPAPEPALARDEKVLPLRGARRAPVAANEPAPAPPPV